MSDGFTLLELLVVLTIIGVISAIAAISLSNGTTSSAIAACRTDFQTISSALAGWRNDNGDYSGLSGGPLATLRSGGYLSTSTFGGTAPRQAMTAVYVDPSTINIQVGSTTITSPDGCTPALN